MRLLDRVLGARARPAPAPAVLDLSRALDRRSLASAPSLSELLPARAQPSLRLAPRMPIDRSTPASSWLGGRPRLAQTTVWPSSVDGSMHFLAQIDYAALPPEMWGGAGPRIGWLAFFYGTEHGAPVARALHTLSLGPQRTAPRAWGPEHLQPEPHAHAPEDWVHEPPRWPVDLVTAGEEDAGELGEQPLIEPHDWSTLRLLLSLVRKALESARAQAEDVLARAYHYEDGVDPDHLASAMLSEAARARAEAQAALAQIAESNSALIALQARCAAAAADGELYDWDEWRAPLAALEPAEVFDDALRRRYDALRAALLARVYVRDPDAVPEPLRGHLLARWSAALAREPVMLGGEAEGGRTQLLCLPSSDVFGWRFGGGRALSLSIPTDALRRGDWSRMEAAYV